MWDPIKISDVKEMCDEQDAYLNNFYRECFVEKIFPFGETHIKLDKFTKIISKEDFSWLFNANELKDRFMSLDNDAYRNKMSPKGSTSPSRNASQIIAEIGEDLAQKIKDSKFTI